MGRDRRKNFRVEWHSPATIYVGALARRCTLWNFSNGGAKITSSEPPRFRMNSACGSHQVNAFLPVALPGAPRIVWAFDSRINLRALRRDAQCGGNAKRWIEQPYSTSSTSTGSSPKAFCASAAAMNSSRSPSSTAPVLEVCTPVRRSFTI
jgi:hypothetical protein